MTREAKNWRSEMRLKNFLIVVNDIEKSRQFYHDLFELNVLVDYDGNMILTEDHILGKRPRIQNRI